MIPQTWPSKIGTQLEFKNTVYAISLLSDVTGLQRWVDYIPVQFNPTPDNLNSYGANDALLVSEETGTVWVDYIPVFEEGTVAWSTDNNGYIPIHIGSPIINFDFAGVKALDPRITFTRASTATYFDANGVMRTASNNEPRFDHNPVTGESLGLLIEEQRTNLLTYSEQFDNAAWNKTRSSITANSIAAPDGTLTADKFVENTDNDIHYIRISTTNGNATYTFAIYVKAAERTNVRIDLSDNTTGVVAGWFNLALGTITNSLASGSWTAPSATITPVGDGWYRCSVTGTRGAGTATVGQVFTISSGTTTSYLGDGTSGLYIWGAQLEAGAFPTSYIKTEGSQVTRAADSALMTGTNFSSWYNALEGTLFTWANSNVVYDGTNRFPTILEISDGTNNEVLRIYERRLVSNDNDLIFAVRDGNVVQAQLQLNTSDTNVGQFYKIAASYKLNDFAGSFDGNTVVTDLSGTIPTVTQASLGSGITGHLNGHIKRIAYYPRRLADAQLAAITS